MGRPGDPAIGMMDDAYFVGRIELLNFFNNLLDLQLAKIEHTASGAIACQLTEYIFPGSIPMSKVNWEAKADFEFISNYKLLQKAFSKHRIQRHVDVDKLIRAKYQDNLEFCQWLKAFYDQSGVVRDDYDPAAVRALGKGGAKYNDLAKRAAAKPGTKSISTGARRGARVTPTTTAPRSAATATRSQPPVRRNPPTTTTTTKGPPTKPLNRPNPSSVPKGSAPKAEPDAKLLEKVADLEAKAEDLEATVLELEKERDFYFGKLRNIELMLQVKQDAEYEGCDLESVAANIFKVLYATAEEIVEVGETGEIIPAHVETSVDISELAPTQPDEVEDDVQEVEDDQQSF
eukprot:Nitzschia sp. Nitz4//scaffold9_size221794//81329//82558//NITZ4_001340-RA/size221794-snap-gene-0.95-mRNA-1//1//CDS//3329560983//3188//frame0